MNTHYETLQVTRSASVEVIRAAYRILAQRHHPDVNPSVEAESLMKSINKAWAVLSDPAMRAEYDKQIGNPENKATHAPDFNDQQRQASQKTEQGAELTTPSVKQFARVRMGSGSAAAMSLFGMIVFFAIVISAPPRKMQVSAPFPEAAAPVLPSLPSNTVLKPGAPDSLTHDQVDLLTDGVRTALTAAVDNNDPPEPLFPDAAARLAYLRWLGGMSQRLESKLPEWNVRKEFLQTVWYESKRAGLDTALVLGLIEVGSDFRKHAISKVGARGLMQVMPFWTQVIGDGDAAKLFHMQTNLRYGCTILRHSLTRENGDLFLGLGVYNGNRGVSAFPNAVIAAKRKWEFDPQADKPTTHTSD